MTEQTLDLPDTIARTSVERPTTMRTIRRYWYLVLVCTVLGAGCGAVYAFKRPQVYTASARLSAISVNDANSASLAGSLEAAQELASTFARDVQSSGVTQAVAAALHTTPAWAFAHVSGTPIPSSPFVRIDATASRPDIAIVAANAALKALTGYARKLVTLQPGSPSLLASIGADAVQLSRAQTGLAQLKAQSQGATPSPGLGTTTSSGLGTTTSSGLQTQIDHALAKVAAAQAQMNGAQAAYTQLAASQPGSRSAVTVSPALSASSDRKQVAEIAVLLGLLVGLVVGVATAMALAARAARAT